MTNLTRWEPFDELTNWNNRWSRLLEPFRSFNYLPENAPRTTVPAFTPLVDIYEDEHRITLKFEVPGMEEKDLDIKVENNTLTVTGERKFAKEEKEENYKRMERYYGAFSRSFMLPTTVDVENAFAEYKNGILSIQFDKKAEARPKQIKVGFGHKLEAKGKAA
jgi:HSP20 family protein